MISSPSPPTFCRWRKNRGVNLAPLPPPLFFNGFFLPKNIWGIKASRRGIFLYDAPPSKSRPLPQPQIARQRPKPDFFFAKSIAFDWRKKTAKSADAFLTGVSKHAKIRHKKALSASSFPSYCLKIDFENGKEEQTCPLPFSPLRGTLSEGLRSAKCKKTQNVFLWGSQTRPQPTPAKKAMKKKMSHFSLLKKKRDKK